MRHIACGEILRLPTVAISRTELQGRKMRINISTILKIASSNYFCCVKMAPTLCTDIIW